MESDDVKLDAYRLGDGSRVYRLTHIATGVFVEDQADDQEPIVTRMAKLRKTLEVKLRRNEGGQPEHET